MVEVGISCPQHPIQLWKLNGNAKTGVKRVLRNLTGEVRHSNSTGEGQPAGCFELVFEKYSQEVTAGIDPLAELLLRAVVGDHRKERVVRLGKRINPGASVV